MSTVVTHPPAPVPGASWAPPGRHYTPLGGSFALARPPAGFPGVLVPPFGVSPGTLWVRSLCFFRVFLRCFDVGPVSVLFAVGCDVRSVHACQCFARLQGFAKPLLGHPDTHKREQKRAGRAGEGARVAPETPDSYQNGAQAPCRE